MVGVEEEAAVEVAILEVLTTTEAPNARVEGVAIKRDSTFLILTQFHPPINHSKAL